MPAAQSAAELRLQRNLKFVVAGLAVLLFAGLLAVAGRVIYLASSKRAQPAAPTLAIRPEQYLTLPRGAQVRSISLSGNRLAVHYSVGETEGIAVLDLQSGRQITNVGIDAAPAGR
jgi:hypothetical protein